MISSEDRVANTFHCYCKEDLIDAVKQAIEISKIGYTTKAICILANGWEAIYYFLFTEYSREFIDFNGIKKGPKRITIEDGGKEVIQKIRAYYKENMFMKKTQKGALLHYLL